MPTEYAKKKKVFEAWLSCAREDEECCHCSSPLLEKVCPKADEFGEVNLFLYALKLLLKDVGILILSGQICCLWIIVSLLICSCIFY